MDESPPARNPAHLAPTRGRQFRATSDTSPARQRNTDDLLSNLTPRTVVDAFRNPSGTLKACFEAAAPSEQAFALRVAIASNSIHEWHAELSAWPWPAGGGPAGFLPPPAAKRRKISELSGAWPVQDHELLDQEYAGSLLITDVARYERRVDDVAQGLEELDIEEIKSQVLNNHIMPLSRPGTPMMDCGRSAMSVSSISKLDDLTALITATTVQALPMLSRLTRLMISWNFRLLVLRKIPVFLASIADAEIALRGGWEAIAASGAATVPRPDFDVIKSTLGRKVAKTGRDLDAMLDILEGQPDTLPDDWLDRVDTLEHGYGEWTVACERAIKEADLAKLAPKTAPVEEGAPEKVLPLNDNGNVAVLPPATNGARAPAPQETQQPLRPASPLREAADVRPALPPVIKIHHPTAEEDQAPLPEDEYPDTDNEFDQSQCKESAGPEPPAVLVSEPVEDDAHDSQSDSVPTPDQSSSDSEDRSNSDRDASETDRPSSRRASNASESSTVIHEAPSTFADSFSSDMLDQGTPERPRKQVPTGVEDASGFQSFRSSTRSMSVSFNDKPIITELPSFPSPPSTPTKSPIPEEDEDDAATEPDSPSEMSVLGADDQLQQQISEILSSVPAKIRLTAEPPAINLNPPDFKMPLARKSSRPDLIPRSASNMSMRSAYSRSATPSFTLAPARNTRPRHQRGNQEIKLYHLSRSNGEAPIKLFIRCVGEHGERVMVRVGGGWADLGEYLKEYATHHLRRSAAAASVADGRIEVKDIPRTGTAMSARLDATPPSRPASSMGHSRPHSPGSVSPLKVRKTRRAPQPPPPQTPSSTADNGEEAVRPKTPLASVVRLEATPPSDASSLRSRSSSRVSWDEEDAAAGALGMAGPRARQVEMSEEKRAWVESVKEKVRIASGERRVAPVPPVPVLLPPSMLREGGGNGGLEASLMDRGGEVQPARFGEMGKVGGTKRLFRRG